MRLLPEQRQSMADAVRRGFRKALVAEVFDMLRKPGRALTKCLKITGLNGYVKNYKHGNFFRAKKPNELWQAELFLFFLK